MLGDGFAHARSDPELIGIQGSNVAEVAKSTAGSCEQCEDRFSFPSGSQALPISRHDQPSDEKNLDQTSVVDSSEECALMSEPSVLQHVEQMQVSPYPSRDVAEESQNKSDFPLNCCNSEAEVNSGTPGDDAGLSSHEDELQASHSLHISSHRSSQVSCATASTAACTIFAQHLLLCAP